MDSELLHKNDIYLRQNAHPRLSARHDYLKKIYIKSLLVYFFLMPLNAISLGTFGSALKIFAAIPIVLSFFAIGQRGKRHSNYYLYFSFVLFACFSLLWSVNIKLSFERIITYILLTMLVFSGSLFTFDNKDIEKIKKGLLWSSRTTAIVMLAFSRFSQGRWMLSSFIYEDPNYLCCYLVFGVAITLKNLLDSKKKFISFLEFVAYLALIIGTGSRGGLLAIIACVMIVAFSSHRFSGIHKKTGLVVFLAALAGVFFLVLNILPASLKNRFSLETIIASGGTGRLEIWETCFSAYKDFSIFEKIFGTGTGTITQYIQIHIYEGYIVSAAAHNIFIETLLELGLLGFLLYTLSIISFARKAYAFKDKFAISIFISMVVLSLTTSVHTFKPYFNIMLFIVICQNCADFDHSNRLTKVGMAI